MQDWNAPDRIIAGIDDPSGKAIGAVRKMYSGIEAPFLVTDVTSAEMIKYASNAFLATRISFINEMASLCDAVGASIEAVSDGLAMDPRTGAKVFSGVGYGGSCLPKDISALRRVAASHGIETGLLKEVARVNERQRQLPIEKLNARFRGRLNGLRVGVLGLAFKPGTDDVREAASLELIRDLVQSGAEVTAFDPKANTPARGALPPSVQLAATAEEAADCAEALMLITEWPEIVGADWEAIAAKMRPPRFLFDGRNALDARRMSRLGFEYLGVGRGDILQTHLAHADADDEAGTPTLEAMSSRSTPPMPKRESELRYA